MSEAADQARAEIEETIEPTTSQIPFSLVERHSNKTTNLIATSPNNRPVEGQRRWFSFKFNQSYFISSIRIEQSNYSDGADFDFEAVSWDKKKIEGSRRVDDGTVDIWIDDFCDSFEFRPPRSWFDGKTINRVLIFGFGRNETGKFIEFAHAIDNVKVSAISEIEAAQSDYISTIERAEKAEANRADAVKEINTLKSQADRQRSSIRRLESERADLTTKIDSSKDILSKNQIDLDAIRIELSTKTKERENISNDISEFTAKLHELRANIDLFPSELSSFVAQGTRNNRTYFWLAIIPIILIGAMFGLLISGAVELTTKITENQNININALIVSRMPYVLVAVAIITACYKISRAFILEILNVNRQRLNLTKISIIAKEVSHAAESELTLTDSEIYNLRLRLKMDLLKDHLKGYISPEFEPMVPRTITSYLPEFPKVKSRSDGTE